MNRSSERHGGKTKEKWIVAKVAFGLFFALNCYIGCRLLYEGGLVRDQFGLSGAGPFYAGGGLWLAMGLCFIMAAALAVSLAVHVYNPWHRRAVVAAVCALGAGVAVYTMPTLLMCAAYHTQVSGGLF